LLAHWRRVIDAVPAKTLIIGGKSMGGRMASRVADTAAVAGVVCLGYPFHAPGKAPTPERVGHLETASTPTLICQGTRDPLGGPDDVAGYDLSPAIHLHWLEDGDHHLVPRKKSGRTTAQNWAEAITAIIDFVQNRS
jgi:hypothetical protein